MLQSGSTELQPSPHVSMPGDIRALLLDDSNFDRARIRRLSQRTGLSIQFDEVDSIDAMDQAVINENYDLILIDYRLPVGDGLVALDHILQNDQNRDAGKIMITGNGAVDTAVQAMRGGCHDYLRKDDMDEEMLHCAIVNALTVARERRAQTANLQEQQGMIKDALLNAMNDQELRKNVVTMFKQEFDSMTGLRKARLTDLSPAEIDALISGFSEEDYFIFH